MLTKLVPETCTCVSQSGTSFLHATELSSIPAQKLSGTWHEPCNVIGWRVVLVQETVINLRQIFMQVSGTSLLSVCHQRKRLLED